MSIICLWTQSNPKDRLKWSVNCPSRLIGRSFGGPSSLFGLIFLNFFMTVYDLFMICP